MKRIGLVAGLIVGLVIGLDSARIGLVGVSLTPTASGQAPEVAPDPLRWPEPWKSDPRTKRDCDGEFDEQINKVFESSNGSLHGGVNAGVAHINSVYNAAVQAAKGAGRNFLYQQKLNCKLERIEAKLDYLLKQTVAPLRVK